MPESVAAAGSSGGRETTAVAYVDASLRGETGHQANACRQIAGELRKRGLGVDVFANKRVEPALKSELGAIPRFRLLPYEQSLAFGSIDAVLQETCFGQDLDRCWNPRRHPFVYFNSVLAPQFAAIGHWLARLPAGCMPYVGVEFGAPSGASCGGWFAQFADQYRRAAQGFEARARSRLLLFSFDSAASAEYAELLQMPVEVLPPVHRLAAPGKIRKRLALPGLTLGFLGQQRTEKGLDLLPNLIRTLLASNSNLHILVQDGDVTERNATAELRRLAASDLRVEFLQEPAAPQRWQELLDRTDMMVLPYDPERYKASYSAIAVECAGAGIPMVVPTGSTMERIASEYQGFANCFDAWTVESIGSAVLRALADFDRLATLAYAGVDAWNISNGPVAFADRLLAFADGATTSVPEAADVHGYSPLAELAVDGLLALREVAKRTVHALHGSDRHAP